MADNKRLRLITIQQEASPDTPGPAATDDGRPWSRRPMKEISTLEMVGRFVAKAAATAGVLALLLWVGWVMLDIKNLQSGFTLP